MDYGLGIIDDLGSEISWAKVRQTKPIGQSEIPPLWPWAFGRNDTREAPGPPAPNKANSDRPSQAAKREVVAPNKANPGRGGVGIDYGLGIIDDLELETSEAWLRRTKPIRQSEIPPLRPSASGRNDARETPGRPAPNKANSDRRCQVAEREVVAPNKPNFVCSVSEPAEGASAENALRRHYERAKQSQFVRFWAENGGRV